jgi:hypothetical protein
MLRCPACGKPVLASAPDCPYCGIERPGRAASVVQARARPNRRHASNRLVACAHCGRTVIESAPDCPHCGLDRTADPSAAAEASPAPIYDPDSNRLVACGRCGKPVLESAPDCPACGFELPGRLPHAIRPTRTRIEAATVDVHEPRPRQGSNRLIGCARCGKPVLESAPDCPACGFELPGRFPEEAIRASQPAPAKPSKANGLKSPEGVVSGLLLGFSGLCMLFIFGPMVSCSPRGSGAFVEMLMNVIFGPLLALGVFVLLVGALVLGISARPREADDEPSSDADQRTP